HKLHVEDWSMQKNHDIFGKCANPNYHGHNYELEVTLTGEIDPVTGYVYDLGELKKIITQKVEDRYDHKNLNLDCPEFKDKQPTAENICVEIYNILRTNIGDHLDISIRLWETPRNSVIYPPIS
ncbi:MAG: 6-pyruvoyl trahydropterin synthase family protein, partial [Saprospiraceae bacterium]